MSQFNLGNNFQLNFYLRHFHVNLDMNDDDDGIGIMCDTPYIQVTLIY